MPTFLFAVTLAAAFVGTDEPAFRHVYVPFEDLDVLFGAKKGVLLDRREFLELWKKAYPDGKPRALPPDEVALIGGNYVGEASDDALTIRGKLTILKNRSGWQTLPLDIAGVAIAEAKLNAAPALLAIGESGKPELLIREPGEHRLEMVLTAPWSQSGDAKAARFRLPAAAGELAVPFSAEHELRLDGSTAPLRASGDQLRIPIFGGRDVGLAIVPARAKGERKSIVIARGKAEIFVTPTQWTWHDAIQVDVAARPLDRLAIELPTDMQPIEVVARDLAKWEVVSDKDRSRLTLQFAAPWLGRRVVEIRALGATPIDRLWNLPSSHVVDALEQTGVCTVDADANLAFELQRVVGARQIAAAGDRANEKRFEAWRRDYAVAATVRTKRRRLAATVASIVNVARSRVDLAATATIEPRNGALFDVGLRLPKAWEVTAVEVAGQPLPFRSRTAGDKLLLEVSLPTPVKSNEKTTLLVKADYAPEAWLKTAEQDYALDLTAIAVEGADDIEGVTLVRAPGEIRVAVADAVGMESVPVATIPDADAAVRIALRHRTDAAKGTLQAQLRSAIVATEIDIAAVATNVALAVDYFVAFHQVAGATDQLAFELPATIAANEVEVAALSGGTIESQTTEEVADGRRRWRLKFHRDVERNVRLWIHTEAKRPADLNQLVALPQLSVDQAVRQSGSIAIEGALDQKVRIEAGDLRSIDPAELPTLPPRRLQGRLVGAYQFRKPPYAIAVGAERQQELAVLMAVCDAAKIESVLSASGSLRQQADFRIANVSLQNLAIELPANSSMLAASLDGKPVELRRQGVQYLISLPAARGADARANVAVHYVTEVAAAPIGELFRQRPPSLNVPVVQLEWTLYLPDDRAVVESKGTIAPIEPLVRESIIGSVRRAVLARRGGRVFNPLETFLLRDGFKSQATFGGVAASVPATDRPTGIAKSVEGERPLPAKRFSRAGSQPGNVNAPAPQSEDRVAAPKPTGAKMATQGRAEKREDTAKKAGDDRLEWKEEQQKLGGAPKDAVLVGRGDRASNVPSVPASKGLLSLQLTLEPVGRPIRFSAATGEGELALRTIDNRLAGAMTVAVALLVAAGAWIGRNGSRRARAFGIGLLIAGSLGLAGLAPLSLLFALDGLFLGALAALAIYLLRAMSCAIFRQATALAALLLLAVAAQLGNCQAPVETGKQNADLPTIYVPYDSKQDPLDSRQIYLPRDEYRTLWNEANPSKVVLPDPKIAVASNDMSLVGSSAGATVRFEASISAWSFRDDWVSLPIPVADAVVSNVAIDGQPAALAGGEQPAKTAPTSSRFPMVFLRGRGSHKITFRFELPARRAGSTGGFQIQLAPIGSGRFRFHLPEAGLEVRPTGFASGWSIREQMFEAAVSTGGMLGVEWRPKASQSRDTAVVHVQRKSRVELGAAGCRLQSELTFTIRGGSIDRFELAMPNDLEIRDVKGPTLADWFLRDQAGARRLVLQLNRQREAVHKIELDAIAPFDSSRSIDYIVPEPSAIGVDRDSGDVFVVGDPSLELAVRDAAGMLRISADNSPKPLADSPARDWPIVAAYRFVARPQRLTIRAARRPARLLAEIRSTFQIERERVRLSAIAAVSQTGQPLVAARLRLPDGFVLERFIVPPGVRWSTIEVTGAAIVEIERPSTNGDDSASPLVVAAQGWFIRDAAKPAVTLASLSAAAQQRDLAGSLQLKETGQWSVDLAPGLDAETLGVHGMRPIEPSSLSATIGGKVALPRRRPPRLAFQQEASPARVELLVRRLAPRVAVDTTTVVAVRETAVAIVACLRYSIERAGIRTVSFLAPAWLGVDVDIVGQGVRQIESFPAGPDKRRFEVSFDRELIGVHDLRVVKQLGMPEDGLVRAARFEPLSVDSTRAFVLLENRSTDQLDRVEPLAGAEATEPDSLPRSVSPALRKRAVETLRLVADAPPPAWKLRFAKPISGLAASVTLMETTMVVSANGQYRAQTTLRVNNRLEQFLPLAFPAETRLWSVLVAGQPSKPAKGSRDGAPLVLLPLPKTSSGEMASTIEVVYSGTIERHDAAIQRWKFPLPSLANEIPVAKSQLSLFLPRDFDYGSFEGMEEIETGEVELNRQEAELNDVLNVLNDYKKGRGAGKKRAFDNLSSWQLSTRNDPPRQTVQSDRGREFQNRVADQNRRLSQELESIKRQEAAQSAEGDRIQWSDYFESQDQKPTDEEAADADVKALEELAANSAKQLESSNKNMDRGLKAKSQSHALQQRSEEQSQSRARLQGQLQSQTAFLNRMQNEGKLNDANAAERQPQQSQADIPNQSALAEKSTLDEILRVYADSSGQPRPPNEPTPSRQGSLSLKINLPREGRELHFVSARGASPLSVAVYPAALRQTGAAAAWLGGVAALALGLAYAASRQGASQILAEKWHLWATSLGIIWWLTLPLSGLGFSLAVFGLVAGVWRRLLLRFAG